MEIDLGFNQEDILRLANDTEEEIEEHVEEEIPVDEPTQVVQPVKPENKKVQRYSLEEWQFATPKIGDLFRISTSEWVRDYLLINTPTEQIVLIDIRTGQPLHSGLKVLSSKNLTPNDGIRLIGEHPYPMTIRPMLTKEIFKEAVLRPKDVRD